MAAKTGDSVDSDYSGRPVPHRPITDEDRTRPHIDDATIMPLDGRLVYTGVRGSFEVDPDTREPDFSRPVDFPLVTIEDVIAAAGPPGAPE